MQLWVARALSVYYIMTKLRPSLAATGSKSTLAGVVLLAVVCTFELFIYFWALPLHLASFRPCTAGAFDIICGNRWDMVTILNTYVLPVVLMAGLTTLLVAASHLVKNTWTAKWWKVCLLICLAHITYFTLTAIGLSGGSLEIFQGLSFWPTLVILVLSALSLTLLAARPQSG